MDWVLTLVTAPWRWLKRVARGFMALSLPARIAWATAFFLTFFVLLTLCALLFSGGSGWTTLQAWWSPGKGLSVIGLVLLVSVLVYYAARLWLHRDGFRFPDIDAAWRAAVEEMERQQIDLRNSPLFLVIGCDGQEQERAIIGDAPVKFLVVSSPSGSGPLHAYAGHDGVFVCLSSIGQACLLADALRSLLPSNRRLAGAARSPLLPTSAGPGLGGLTLDQGSEATDRLAALCELIRSRRRPVAPINGIMALVPFVPPDEPLAAYTTMGQAICDDVLAITKAFGLRVPLTVAFTDFDKLEGFPELTTHFAASERTQALGQAFPPSIGPSADQLAAIGTATCRRLIELMGSKFSGSNMDDHAVTNRTLITLMAGIRLTLIDRIKAVLGQALNFSAPGAGPTMLSGCYVMGTDVTADRRAFVRGVFERMIAVQAELDWNPIRVSTDRWCHRLASLLRILCVSLVLGAVGLILWRTAR
jgi:hypothetical protein